MEPFLV